MSNTPDWWQTAKIHIAKKDSVLADLIARYPNLTMQRTSDAFTILVKSIIGQQISTKAASTMFERLQAQVPIDPISIVNNQNIVLQAAMSNSKKQYILNIANWFVDNAITADYWQITTADQIAKDLIAIKGIGPWTVNMFQMFYLHNPNVLPLADLGLINGFAKLYNIKADNKTLQAKIASHSEQHWQPYATMAVWFIWRYLDGAELNY